ncbi:ribulose bisphosphate carboxylase/oxygenase activase, chloroplastic isoform X3 [Jatropha curcas]|uniref:ribulose bisphosphate carboxylase/oxygenase activase, chloroplastic isoform X3 n=1 Tax=Jatropha curcas TaxID=180498 RepID=UPI0005FAB25C|nr:ribulose bisphosphate carboxylase/oxygenase activase, chloroplastic isoform X3 [Jatropha curcas]
MALFNITSSSLLKPQSLFTVTPSNSYNKRIAPFQFPTSCSQSNSPSSNDHYSAEKTPKKRLSEQSSWEAKDSEGKDYLYRLGKEADNMNIAVGARAGVIDPLFAGNFLGKDSDIVFDYRQKVTRSFEYLKGDYYIAPVFLDKVVCHIVKNYIAHLLDVKVPLILGIWGGKGQGKSFQTELIFQAMGVEPVIMSAGELESERAGEPGKLIRERYRTASQVVQNQGKMSCLMINDIDAGLGRFGNTQMTVNNQIVVGTLMNLSDNPTRVSIGQDWRESDVTKRIPIIVTGNDFSRIYAPLIRDGRMEKFYWQPNHEDIVNIVHRMYEKDGISKDEVISIVNTFPNQGMQSYIKKKRDQKALEYIVHPHCICRSNDTD